MPLQQILSAILAVVDHLPAFEWLPLGEAAAQPVELGTVGPWPLQDSRRLADNLFSGVTSDPTEGLVDIHDLGAWRFQFRRGDHHRLPHVLHGGFEQVNWPLNLLAAGRFHHSVIPPGPRKRASTQSGKASCKSPAVESDVWASITASRYNP